MRRSVLISTLFIAAAALAGTLWLVTGSFDDGLMLSPEAIDFGVVGIGEEVQQVAIATNAGDAPLEIESIRVPAGFQVSRPGLRIAPGESAEILISFRPEKPGRAHGKLLLEGPSLRARSLELDALGQLPPAIEVTPQLVSFGEVGVGRSSTVEVVVSNRGQGQLSIVAVVAPKPFRTSLTSLDVPAGESRSVELSFSPEEVGDFEEFLAIRSNDPERKTVQVRLGGSALAEAPDPRIEVNPLAVDFGQVSACTGPLRWVTVRNGGSDALTLSAFRYPEGFLGPARSRQVKPGREFSFPVTFAPRSAGALGGELKIFSNDPTAGMVAVALRGNGAACSDDAIAQIAERRPGRPGAGSGGGSGGAGLRGSGGGAGFGGGANSVGGADGGLAAGETADEGSPDLAPAEPRAIVGEDSSWRLASYESKFSDLNVDTSFYDPKTGNLRLEISPPAIDAALGEFFQGEWVIEGRINRYGDFEGAIDMTIYDTSGNPTQMRIPIPPPDFMTTADGQPVFAGTPQPFVDGEGDIMWLDILPPDFTLGGQPIRGTIHVTLKEK
jgi:hypothetical protein